MKKNKRSATFEQKPVAEKGPLLTKQSIRFLGAGLIALVIGYTVLSFADSKAQNLPGKISPFLILGGYALIGIGLFVNNQKTKE